MKLNLNLYKEYRLSLGKFISDSSKKEYKFDIEDNDRFYIYMKQHINNGQINGKTQIIVDELFIEDADKTFFDEESFTLEAKLFVTTKQDIVYVYDLIMRNVKIVHITQSKSKYDGNWVLKMYAMEIPANTEITVLDINS